MSKQFGSANGRAAGGPGAGEEGIELVGPNGLLSQLTKRVLETALEAEMTDHLGYDKHDPVGRNRGNSRNGVRSKTVLTEIGPVEIEVPRDVEASFTPPDGVLWGSCRERTPRAESPARPGATAPGRSTRCPCGR